jgi:hypothetical protein
MKIEKGSLIDKRVHNLPMHYISYIILFWICIIIALVYWMVKI